MVTQLEFVAFTLGPILVMGAAIVYCTVGIYQLDDYRPFLLVGLLGLMTAHQLTEVLQFEAGTFYRTTSPFAESFESGANLLASLAAYFTVRLLGDERERRDRLAEKSHELAEFRQAAEAAGLAVAIADERGRIRYVNPAFEAITGYDEAEALGNSPAFLSPAGQDEESLPDVVASARDGASWQGEVTKQRATGELFVASQTTSPIFDDDGDVQGVVSIFRDITDETRKDQYLEILERVLRHNLRNELTIVAGTARRLQEKLPASDVTTEIDHIESACADLLRLVEHSSDISQLLEGGRRGRALDAILADARAECLRAHPDARVTVEGDDRPVTVDERIEPALVELCDNAVKHGGASSPVEVTVDAESAEDDLIDIAVTDRGPGIPEQEKAVLRQGKETPLKHGSGLGLWLVYLAVTTAGGRISISESEPGGSTVTVSIPEIGGERALHSTGGPG